MIVLGYSYALPGTDMRREAAALRDRMLSSLCGIGSPQIARGKCGKPYLADRSDVFFSVSHTDSLAVCVLSFPGRGDAGGYEVLCDTESAPETGADAELIRQTDQASRMRRLAERFFPQDEARRLADLPDCEIPREFARAWTLCESYVKMTGEGFGSGFSALDFRGVISPCRTLRCGDKEFIIRAAWRKEDIE